MPRDGSGIMSKAAGTTAAPNTIIESGKYNATIDDIIQDLNTARPIPAGGTGATTAAGARSNLEISALNTPFSPTLSNGATNVQSAIGNIPIGINVLDATTRASSFSVVASDMGILHICAPTAGATINVTLPPANAFIGDVIAFMIEPGTSGRVRFLSTPLQANSVVSDYSTDGFWVFHREVVTLRASAIRWEILDWQRNPIHFQPLGAASNTALSTVGAAVELAGWIPPAWDSTYLRHFIWGLDSGTPQRVIIPRRGKFLIEVDMFITWSGTPPTSLYAAVANAAGTGIPDRAYATFIQPTTPTQALIKYKSVAQGNAATQLAVSVVCIGGTSPVIAGAAAQPSITLTELV